MMQLTENRLKWLMRLYPPLFFQRIWVQEIGEGFRFARIRITRSLLTTNLGKSIFGGTLFAAGDPFYALLVGQIFRAKGFKITVWLKSAEINYLKPVRTNAFYTIELSEDLISELENVLKEQGKFVKSLTLHIYDETGDCCVRMVNEIYVRDLNFIKV